MTTIKTDKELVIGSRGSPLALWQAEWVRARLLELDPELRVTIEKIKTKGDKILDTPLAQVGGKGLFVKEIEEALLAGRVDLAVHSLKDMPAESPAGLTLSAIPEREDPRDCVVSRSGGGLAELPKGAQVGTSSLRRTAQLLALRPDVKVEVLRGNVGTRLKKVEEGVFDAVLLAAAGVKRLGLEKQITAFLDPAEFVPAVGQGALAIQTRDADERVLRAVRPLNNEATAVRVAAERAFLARLEGGCQVPIAAHALLIEGELVLDGLVAATDGKTVYRRKLAGPPAEAERIGRELAGTLLDLGAREILDEIYGG